MGTLNVKPNCMNIVARQFLTQWNFKKLSITLLILFGAVMILIPVTNHYFFRTFACDYGAYNFALYDYAHFRISPSPVYFYDNMSFLQDHLSYTLIFLSPFYWLLKWFFGTYTLLIIQSLFVIWGGWASWKFVTEKTESAFFGFLTLVLYFTMYGRYSAFAGDCNLMIILSSFVPVFMLYFHRGKTLITIACFLFLILGRESMPLWTLFISIFLMVLYRKERQKVKLAGIFALVSVAYFIFAFKVLIPYIEEPTRPFNLFNYSNLGETPMEALKFMFSHPLDTLELLFINTSGESYYDNVKYEFYLVYLLSGGILVFLRPYYVIPLIPIIAQKMFNDSPVRWGIASYYDVEVTTLLPILIVLVLATVKWKKVALFLGSVACIMSISITLHKLRPYNCELPWAGEGKINPTDRWFYHSDLNIAQINAQLSEIPADAKISATGNIVPHLAFRDEINYLPGALEDADYIIVLHDKNHFLMTQEVLDEKIEAWRQDPELIIKFEDKDLLIFKRKESN